MRSVRFLMSVLSQQALRLPQVFRIAAEVVYIQR